ncbi:MAG: hypothetical protein K0S22_1763 [Oscillospiraceae bacterium]|jgi:hypothetical protein|nr:hypothetical protein [Oscillospiraceae bacterium]
MVSVFVGLFRLFLCFLRLLWLMFTEYIEWFDAAVLGFIAYLATYHNKLPDNACIAAGVVIAILFLLVFKTRIGWWISTGVFSLMWAYLTGELAVELFRANDIIRWVIVAGSFCYFAWLHDYVKVRKLVHEQYHKEQAEAKARKNLNREEEHQSDLAVQRRIQAQFDEINRLAELRQSQKI